MTTFQLIALLLTLTWLILVIVRFRRSTVFLILGLLVIGSFTLVEFLLGQVGAEELGLAAPGSWLATALYALAGLVVTLACSPIADRVASRWFKKPPTLQAFQQVQRSWVSLVVGILVAWVLGGFLEELIARGIVLNSIDALLAPHLGAWVAAIVAILVAAAGAGLLHSYQGARAMVIIAQISVLFGVLFVVSGHNLWAVVICHGLYDTIAFIRFALRKSKYSRSEGTKAG
jgi:membrane protease YdiL (CAAX protease family)